MSVTGELNKKIYAGNGVTTSFAFPNTLYTKAALGATLTVDSTDVDTLQTQPTEYDVTLAVDFSTATVEMVAPPASGETLTIYRVEPDTQTLDYVEGGEFPSEATEIAMDKGTLESQTQAEQLKRCIKLPVTVQDASNNPFDGETNKPTAVSQYFEFNDTTKVFELVNPVNSQDSVTPDVLDELLLADASDSFKLKKMTVSELAAFLSALVISVNGKTGVVVLDPDDLSDTSTTNKWNIAHTSEVTGATALTVNKVAITNKSIVTAASGDYVMVTDGSDSDDLKRVNVADFMVGSGDVVGPASATDNALSRFNGTTGKIIQNYTSGAPTCSDIGVINTSKEQTLTSVSITGAATSTANSYHVLTGTTSDYTVTLTAGVSGERQSFFADAALTEIVTLDGDGTETIGTGLTYKMAAGDYILLEFDGSNWRIIEATGHVYVTADSNAGQGLTGGTTNLQFEDNIIDPTGSWNGTDTFTAPKAKPYTVCSSIATTGSTGIRLAIFKNGSDLLRYSANRVSSANNQVAIAVSVNLAVGDTLTIRCDTNETRTTNSEKNWITISEGA